MLQRDLLAFARDRYNPASARVEYKLLRDEPTQTGVSYPKYYAWIRVFSKSGLLQEGAVRLQAIKRERFEVTNFLTSPQLQASPADASALFPPALVPIVLDMAGAR